MIEQLEEVNAELENWARWGRDAGGPHGYPEPSVWRAWISFKGRIAGWGLTEAEKEAEARGEMVTPGAPDELETMDEKAAEHTDRKLCYLREIDPHSYVAIHKHYYRRRWVDEDDLMPALRHFVDLTDFRFSR